MVSDFPRAGFRRRVASWVYDLFIATAVYMTAGAISFLLIALMLNFEVIGMQGYEHVSDTISNTLWLTAFNEIFKWFWVGYFFVFFWTQRGQTLGMRAWRLRVQNQDGSLISRATGVKRLLPTLLGLGNITVIFDRKNKLSLQDRLTKTEVVILSLAANRGKL